jgi:uncharacterized membrane protein required for colicin V production
MVFWIGILIACLFAWLAVKMGFYETWVLLFNLVIAVYLAVFLGPVLANIFPICRDTMYNNLLCIIAAAVGGFLVLHGIAYYLFTSQYSVPFPKAIDSLVAGLFGFLIGFLVWTFVSLLICISPIAQNTFVSEFNFVDGFKQKGAPYVGWWCDRVNSIVASEDSDATSEQIISTLLKNAGPKTPAEPNQPDNPNNIKTNPITNPNVNVE